MFSHHSSKFQFLPALREELVAEYFPLKISFQLNDMEETFLMYQF